MVDKSKPKAKGADLTGLDNFNVSSFLEGGKKDQAPEDSSSQTVPGSVSYAPLAHFHEDPENARKEFDPEKLKELAESMEKVNPTTGKPRGIMEPLSVKHHPDKQGHYLISGGNRRFRAASMIGLEEAPFIIKDELDDFDKFVLNDQREALSPLEIAMFIKARLEENYKSGEIAAALGRRPGYVSDHSAFFEMADCIRGLYDDGLCRSMQVLARLHRAHKKHPEAIEAFCQEAITKDLELTASQVQAFIEGLKKPKDQQSETDEKQAEPGENDQELEQEPKSDLGNEQPPASAPEEESNEEPYQDQGDNTSGVPKADEEQQPLTVDGEPLSGGYLEDQAGQILEDDKADRIKKPIIQVRHDEREARLLTDRRAAYGLAWIKYLDDGHEVEVDLNQVGLVAIIEG